MLMVYGFPQLNEQERQRLPKLTARIHVAVPEPVTGRADTWSIPVAVQQQIGLCTPAHQKPPKGRHQLALCVIAGSRLQTIDISLKPG